MGIAYVPIDGEVVSVPWFRILDAARRSGQWQGRVNEGHRTMARQQWLYDHRGRADLGIGSIVARPSPNAPHIRVGRLDHAVDVTDSQGLINFAARHGIRLERTVSGESWHLEPKTANWASKAAALAAKRRGDVLQEGDRGPGVRVLRNKLWHLGGRKLWPPVIRTSGKFGPLTKRMVRKFQRAAGLRADGIVGPRTWAALNSFKTRRRVRAVLAKELPPPPAPKPRPVDKPKGRARHFADISGYNEGVSLGVYKGAGYDTIAIKLTEGVSFISDTGTKRWKEADRAGLRRIAYHFARPSRNSAVLEARHFARVLKYSGPLRDSDILVLDWEDEGYHGKGDAWMTEFFNELTRQVRSVPRERQWLYSYGDYARATLSSTHGRRYWHAAYISDPLSTVPAWARKQLVAVQFTDGTNGDPPHHLPGMGFLAGRKACDVSRWI